MRPRVLYSRSDPAGTNIAGILRDEYSVSAEGLESSLLYLGEKEAAAFSPGDLCIVASRHKSESGTPTLTAHSPGNFSSAGAGGSDGTLGIAPALYLAKALSQLKKDPPQGYEICLEATHHGPTNLPSPVLFVEVGSGEREWSDAVACRKAADAIHSLLSEPKELPVALGFGGGHYCRKFSEQTQYAVGHICPKYHLAALDEEMLLQMIEKTHPSPSYALLDRKGLGKEKKRVLSLLDDTTLETVYL